MDEPIKIPLDQFQEWMQQLLLDPFQQTDVSPLSMLPDAVQQNASDTTGISAVIENTSKLNAQRHLGIYQRGYIARLRNCMSQQFSALEYALGEDIFIAFADGYLASQPSSHYNLGELGKAFPNYMQINRPDADAEVKEDWIDFMIELALFEFDFGVLYEAKGDENYIPAELSDSEDAITLRDVADIYTFQFPIRWYYSEFKNDKKPSLPGLYRSHMLVIRHDFQMAIYDLFPDQYAFLSLVKSGLTIPEAKLKFKEDYPKIADQFDEVWPEWKRHWTDVKLFGKRE